MRLAFVVAVTLAVAACPQPISLQDLAGKIQVSELSLPDELVSAALAWSLTQTPTDRVCDYAKDLAPSYAVARAVSLAKCENIKVDISRNPETLNELYNAIMAKPESSYFKPLLAMVNGASQLDRLIILHAGAFLVVNNLDLKETTECKQLISLFNKLIKSSSKDLLRFGDYSASSLQKANHLGFASCYLESLGLVKPEPGTVQMLAEIITSQPYVRSTEDIAAIIDLATCLVRYSTYHPVISDVVNKKDGILSLKITDIFGRPVEVDSVTVVSCKSSQGKSLSPVKQSVSDGIYQLKFDLESADPGIYQPIIKITSQGHDVLYDTSKMALTVFGVVELERFKAWTSSKHEDSISSITASYPNESEDVLGITSASTHLHVAFKLNSNLEDVAYIGIAFVNMDTNRHTVLTPTKRTSGNYQLKLKYTHSTFSSRIPGNGRYQIKLLISDPELPDYIDWDVCNANINLARIPGAVRSASDFIHMPKPLVKHRFRDIPTRSNFLWIPFTLLLIVPLFGLLFAWSRLHVNIVIDKKPANILFHSLLFCCLLTLVSYWTGTINLIQLLRPISVILPSLAFSYNVLIKVQNLQSDKFGYTNQGSIKQKAD